MTIPRLPADASLSEFAPVLEEAGCLVVTDLLTADTRQTVRAELDPLLAAARQRGNRTVNGLGMLLHQARPAWQAWFGIEPEVTAKLRTAIEATF